MNGSLAEWLGTGLQTVYGGSIRQEPQMPHSRMGGFI